MCGIIAVKGQNVLPKIIDGLKSLEYRGYDSCGLSYKTDVIHTVKTIGYIDNLEKKIPNKKSNIGIGHTRWATHGIPCEKNSHPHISESGKIACVHNGILENYKELKDKYLSNIKLKSETDSEIIPNLIEYFYNKQNRKNLLKAFFMAIQEFKGSFAIAFISEYDNNIYFARSQSPLVISKFGDEFFLSSDVNGLYSKNQVFYLPNNYVGVLSDDFHVYDNNLQEIDIKYTDYSNIVCDINKDGFEYFMLKEIYEIPNAIKKTHNYLKTIEFVLPEKIDNILFVSCGTSYHSSLVGKKYIEKFAQIPVECEIASEFLYNEYLVKPNTLAIFITQSGETADTLKSLELAKNLGLFTLAITNVPNSSVTQLADSTINMQAGVEICVASTKAYTTQIYVLLELTNFLINQKKGLYKSIDKNRTLIEGNRTINYIPYSEIGLQNLVDINISDIDIRIDKVADKLAKLKHLHIIGKNYDYITAMEGSLKIKEISYIFTDAYPCGELKHGTLSLIDNDSYVVAIMTERKLIAKTLNAIHEIISRGGKVICITPFVDVDLSDACDVIFLPDLESVFLPIVSIIPFHLLSYKITRLLGYNPDKPRNLAKSVTVE